MQIEIIYRNLDKLVSSAIESGQCDDLEILGEIAARHPQAKFVRHEIRQNGSGKTKMIDKEFSSQIIIELLTYNVEIRPFD